MPRGDDIRIHEIPSDRWEIALDCLDNGGPMSVLAGEPLSGCNGGPDGRQLTARIHVSIFTTTDPSMLTIDSSSREAKAGLTHLKAALATDPRLDALFERHGVVVEYVCDYGQGAVQVGSVDEAGEVELL